MSRLTAIRYASRVVDSLCDRDPGSLEAAQEACGRLAVELSALAIREAHPMSQTDHLGDLIARAIDGEGA